MTYDNPPHPTDGSECPPFYRGYRGCPSCIKRGHSEGHHDECDPVTCNAARDAARGYDFAGGEPRFRYDVVVADQGGRILYRNYDFVIVNGYAAGSAAVRVASDARFWFEKDLSVTSLHAAAGAKDDMNQFGTAAYTRREDEYGTLRWVGIDPDGDLLHEVIMNNN